jgi:hypothetical protein
LLGAFAGPAGVAIGIAGGAAIGAATGAVIGGAVDLDRSDTRDQAQVETGLVLGKGEAAVIADVSEDWEEHLDRCMRDLGGVVYRRSSASLHHDALPGYTFSNYMYPYAYVPGEYPGLATW